jgi:hypothetical protein
MKTFEDEYKNLKNNLPKLKTYWNWYNFCSGLRKEIGLNQNQFNVLVQQMREIYLK